MKPYVIIGLLLCLPVFAAPQGDSGPPADILAVRQLLGLDPRGGEFRVVYGSIASMTRRSRF